MTRNREAVPQAENVLGLNGIEFIEYATTKPQALGQVLEKMGFSPVARHRSREVVLYRQGPLNLVINAHPSDARVSATSNGAPVLSAVAFRVRDARAAHERCLERGAWDVPAHAQAMELNIPGIHGPGPSRFYFVDRQDRFSIYDIDFDFIPGVAKHTEPLTDFSYFGVVQYIGLDRTQDWCAYYSEFFGFSRIPDHERFGILPRGSLLRSPCGQFLWQLIEPDPAEQDDQPTEQLHRIGLGVSDVPAAKQLLSSRGIEFVNAGQLNNTEQRGALTRSALGSVSFELVHRRVSP
jgi:4-hydroxyphenylpyruvate dioxygenase